MKKVQLLDVDDTAISPITSAQTVYRSDGDTTVESSLVSISENLTNYAVIYNPTDDYFYVGSEKWKRAYMKSLVVFDSDGFADGFSLGAQTAWSSGYVWKSWTLTDHTLYGVGSSSSNQDIANFINGAIDFSKYTKLYATCSVNSTEIQLSCDISSVNMTGYLDIRQFTNSGHKNAIGFFITSSNSGYLTSNIIEGSSQEQTGLGMVYNVTKIWLE